MTAPRKSQRSTVICTAQVACDGDPVFAQYSECPRCRAKKAKQAKKPQELKGEKLMRAYTRTNT